ncbi:hypothetical protein [Delftia acidovorans]
MLSDIQDGAPIGQECDRHRPYGPVLMRWATALLGRGIHTLAAKHLM